MILDNTIQIKSGRVTNNFHKKFLNDFVIPYLVNDLGYEEVLPRLKKEATHFKYFRVFKKDAIKIYCAKRHYKNLIYFVVTEHDDLVGTLVYKFINLHFHLALFQADLFCLFNEGYETTFRFGRREDYHKEEGFHRRTPRHVQVPRGNNPVGWVGYNRDIQEGRRDTIRRVIARRKLREGGD